MNENIFSKILYSLLWRYNKRSNLFLSFFTFLHSGLFKRLNRPNLRFLLIPEVVPFIGLRKEKSISACLKRYSSFDSVKRLKQKKSSDTLAILGSGSSINELTENDLKFISDIDSMALNRWGIHHNFIPDFYKVELPNKKFADFFATCLNSKASRYKDTIFMFLPNYIMFRLRENFCEFLDRFDEQIQKNAIPIRIFGKSPVSKDSNFNLKHLELSFPQYKDRFLTYSGSLSTCLSIGYYLGYEKMILFGVDLKGPYFFDPVFGNQPKETDLHTTAARGAHRGIDEFILYLEKHILDDCKLYIGSKKSLLYPQLPYFKENFEV